MNIASVMVFILGLILASGCASTSDRKNEQRAISAATTSFLPSDKNAPVRARTLAPKPFPFQVPDSEIEIPNSEAIRGQPMSKDFLVSSKVDPISAPALEETCDKSDLYPAHPYQTGKKYHMYTSVQYDHMKLNKEDEACKIPNHNTPNTKFNCASPDSFHYVVLSDTYVDSCGKYFRGFWEVGYFVGKENQGHLNSLGRTVYPVQNSKFTSAVEVYTGGTNPLNRSQFWKLTPLFPEDELQISKSRELARKEFRMEGNLFILNKIPNGK